MAAYDAGVAALLRDDLEGLADRAEKRMFGGLCFLSRGHMVCGVDKDGAMFRVGPEAYEAALALPGVTEMDFTGRPMRGFVSLDGEGLGDDEVRLTLLGMARAFVAGLPDKAAGQKAMAKPRAPR